ncbi:glycoside hydrolase family 32 protein [uncultured Anaerococcus sp.]|uniref:glycoside hydrolase family 32 protein n=1 Tax=uncultured Anaerococcus sp. TaxID=293428 RepID=UPI0028890BC6|nr:glycoside hydrolase family 32 protein [uncultured Anaerococcus sp.]
MLDKKTYQNAIEKREKMKANVATDPFLLDLHVYPETGWLNDPNGLCYFAGLYHFYFQYSPLDAKRGDIIWGHVSSPDFISYKRQDPFIFADSPLDKDGAYSGSAFIKDGKINFFYTGNVKHEGYFDYITAGRDHNTIKIISDAYSYDEKILVMDHDDYPSDMTRHIRDPKIYEKDGAYYMFLGARSLSDKGMVLIFKSQDLKKFTYHMRVETPYDFGYMWECPDYFDLDGQGILICCPQGLESEEYTYQNIYQAGYFPLDLDLENKTYKLGDFVELDYGFDFYAPQTFEDPEGRRILIGWMGMPDAAYTNPTDHDWQHAFTIPRVLSFVNGKVYQKPIGEYQKLRESEISLEKGTSYQGKVFEAVAENIRGDFSINIRKDVTLSYENGILILDMGDSSYGRKTRMIKISKIEKLEIFSDKSSLEIFINDGEKVMTTRVYSEKYAFSTNDFDFKIHPLNPITFE